MKNKGFTIVELMIATSVFTILLLLALAGFLQIGRLFYKGVNITQTTNDSNQVLNSIKNDIAFSSPGTSSITINTSPTITTPAGAISRKWLCAGPNRYSFILGRELDTSKEAAEMNTSPNEPFGWYQFGILRDRLPNATSCPDPYRTSPKITKDTVTELLGGKMRLSNLTVTPVSPSDPALKNMYTLNVRIAYGDDGLLTSPASSPTVTCQSGVNFSTYCFWMNLRTSVRQGI